MNESSFNGFNLDPEYLDLVASREWMDCPEQRLVWAIVERCVRDILGNQRSDCMAAIAWLFEKEAIQSEAFSFLWCCDALEIDANAFRIKVLLARGRLHSTTALLTEINYDKAA